MLKQAIPNIFVKDFQAALAYYTGPLGFRPLFVYGKISFYAHVARDEAILAIRHVTRTVIDHTAGEALLSAFIEVSDVNALHDSLQAAGAHIWQAPRDEPWAMRSLIVSDLDSNLICFASNLPRWLGTQDGAGANRSGATPFASPTKGRLMEAAATNKGQRC